MDIWLRVGGGWRILTPLLCFVAWGWFPSWAAKSGNRYLGWGQSEGSTLFGWSPTLLEAMRQGTSWGTAMLHNPDAIETDLATTQPENRTTTPPNK